MTEVPSERSILVQLDVDPHPSVFDRIVALDSGVDEVLAYGGVGPEAVESLVHGAMFTRHPERLHRTALFIGGSDVAAAEGLLDRARKAFFGPLSVSVFFDAGGCNTTAAAAVLAAGRHLALPATRVLVLGGTGPVGQRAGGMLARAGAQVRLASRSLDRARAVAERLAGREEAHGVEPVAVSDSESLGHALGGVQLVIAAGAAGVELLPAASRRAAESLRVAIDLNAVPPAGIEGVEPGDKGREEAGCLLYGPIGVGGTKMKIHRAAIASLFESNDRVLDAEAVCELAHTCDL